MRLGRNTLWSTTEAIGRIIVDINVDGVPFEILHFDHDIPTWERARQKRMLSSNDEHM